MARTLDMLVAISAQVYDLPNVSSPLAGITQIIGRERHTPRARVLAAILHGIATEKEEFAESDLDDLDYEALGLVVLLAQEVLNGRHAKQELLPYAEHAGQK